MDKQPPSEPPQQNIKIDDSSFDKTQNAIAGGNLVQNQSLVNFVVNLFGNQESSRQKSLRRQKLLTGVKTEVNILLERLLHEKLIIPLDKEKHPQQVQPIKGKEIKVGSKQITPLPPETSIVEVFDEVEVKGELLILGVPGAGKTIAKLEIAKELITRAETDPDASQPLPVLFNLSSWKKDQNIASWLVDELSSKGIYGSVPKNIGQRWLNEGQLIPLLDGLDELESTRQEKCVEAINNFLDSGKRPPCMVVCSRQEEYELYETKLSLNQAILLKPLTQPQIREYLQDKLGRSEIWKRIENNPNLLNLAKTPLLLHIMIPVLKEGESSFHECQNFKSEKELIRCLFNEYTDIMLERIGQIGDAQGKQLSPKKVKRMLIWLAKILERENEKEFSLSSIKEKGFLIENIQPSLLKATWQK